MSRHFTWQVSLPDQKEAGEEMADIQIGAFLHRMNSDGRYDSICSDCLRTISSRLRESDLKIAEEHHICYEVVHRLIGERLGRRAQEVN
jgi:hypothetical protein